MYSSSVLRCNFIFFVSCNMNKGLNLFLALIFLKSLSVATFKHGDCQGVRMNTLQGMKPFRCVPDSLGSAIPCFSHDLTSHPSGWLGVGVGQTSKIPDISNWVDPLKAIVAYTFDLSLISDEEQNQNFYYLLNKVSWCSSAMLPPGSLHFYRSLSIHP